MEWVCHCTVHVYDGVSTLTARPTEIVDATDEQEACAKARKVINERYERLGCKVNSISIPLVRQSVPQRRGIVQKTRENILLNDFRARTVQF